MIYLASPYSHPDPFICEQRFRAVCRAAAELMRQGQQVFSPVAHSHPLVECGLPPGWDFWGPFDRWFIERCDVFAILTLDGWEQSVGVTAEIQIAKTCDKPFRYINPQPPDAGEERSE